MDDDSGAGALVGLAIIVGIIYIVIQIVIFVVTVIAMAVAALLAATVILVTFVGAGVGGNLLWRAVIGFIGDQSGKEQSVPAARWGLGLIYAAPWALLIIMLPFTWLDPATTQAIWFGALLLSVPAYYWTWWSGKVSRHTINWERPRIETRIPEMHLEVPFKFDATMQAEERILVARAHAALLLVIFQLRVAWLELKTQIKDWWQAKFEEVRHGTLGR